MSGLVDIIREVVFRNRDRHANPVLDGPMRPNARLDECPVVGEAVAEPDDIAFPDGGVAWITGGRTLYRFAGGDFSGAPQQVPMEGTVTGLAANPDGGVAVAVAGKGIALVGEDGAQRMIAVAGLNCPTALTFGPGGDLYVCDGSRDNPPERWVFDLMEKRSSGRVLRVDPATGAARVLADNLRWPNGICVALDGQSLVVTEAWSHSILQVGFDAVPGKKPRRLMDNLPGYPARIVAHDGGYCLAYFALRTQLVDFVLTEDGYRNKMIARIDPAFWVAPALRSEGHYLEPVQGGGLKKHGSLKAWAPPRSYGLVVMLDEEFEPIASFHSRVGGSRHGITGIGVAGGAVIVTSKGNGKIIRLAREQPQ